MAFRTTGGLDSLAVTPLFAADIVGWRAEDCTTRNFNWWKSRYTVCRLLSFVGNTEVGGERRLNQLMW